MLTGAGQPTNAFLQFGRPPTSSALSNFNSICGRTENSSQLHADYCAAGEQNLMSGWGTRRNEWQFGLGVQHELLPRVSGEVTYNYRKYRNLTSNDIVGRGCDWYLASDPKACTDGYLAFQSPNHDFYSLPTTPSNPDLPNGGGYAILGLNNQNTQGALPNLGTVTTIQNGLSYSWGGFDTNFVFRGRGGMRISGGTSTGRSLRNTCDTDIDGPNTKGREGNPYGGGCVINNPYQTNIRANASYTIPWVDVLVGAVYQRRPGTSRSANLQYSNLDVAWNASSAARATAACDTNGATAGGETVGCFYNQGGNPGVTATTNLLDWGDLFGEPLTLVDLNFQKNLRFAGKRVNFGVQVYNLFNSDAVTGYNNTYTAFRLPDGTWVEDNPNTADVEVNNWGNVTNIITPRFMRFSVAFNF
jgi:hypothetical protein